MTEVWPYVASLGILTGLVHLILLLLLLFRHKDTGAKLALLYMVFSLLWITAFTLADLQRVFIPLVTDPADRLILVFATALAAVELSIVCVILEIPWIGVIGGISAGWTVALLVGTVYSLLDPSFPLPLPQIAQGGWAALAIALIIVIAISLFRSRLALHRNRALYWLMAAVPLALGQAFTLLPAGPLRGLGGFVHLFGAIALFRGTTTYWLPNVKAMLRSILRFVFLVILTILLFLGVITGSEWLTAHLPFSSRSIIILLTIITALIYVPLYRLLTRLVDRLLTDVGFDPAQALREYSQTIGTVLDLEQLAYTAVNAVADVLDVQRGALLMVTGTERGGMRLEPVPGLGEIIQDPIELEPISPLLVRFREQDTPLFQYEIEHHPSLREAPRAEREWFKKLRMEIYLPIRSQDELTGILALGPQGTGEPYSPRAIEFLSTLSQQSGVALQNASLFEGLRALNIHITELNENLRAAYERLERLDKAKADFLAIASHELRTPLTQVRGYIDVLSELSASGALSPEQLTRISSSIAAPVRRLESIINALLDASRIDTEGLSLHFVPTSLATTMRMAVDAWAHALKERQITLTTEGIEEIPPIHADQQRLFQAFGNLISNAIKFTPDGGRIAITATPLDNEHFEVTISDTGIGISKADQELIFEKFYRVGSVSLHSSGEYKFKGAGPGLGLPIARGVIEGHGGCIWVESEGYDEERCPGSTFHIVLPYKAHRGACRWQRPKDLIPSDVDVMAEIEALRGEN